MSLQKSSSQFFESPLFAGSGSPFPSFSSSPVVNAFTQPLALPLLSEEPALSDGSDDSGSASFGSEFLSPLLGLSLLGPGRPYSADVSSIEVPSAPRPSLSRYGSPSFLSSALDFPSVAPLKSEPPVPPPPQRGSFSQRPPQRQLSRSGRPPKLDLSRVQFQVPRGPVVQERVLFLAPPSDAPPAPKLNFGESFLPSPPPPPLPDPLSASSRQPQQQSPSLFPRRQPVVGTPFPLKPKRVHQKPEFETIDSSRVWQVVQSDPSFVDSSSFNFSISMKTRLTPSRFLVSSRLYSTIQYQFFVEFSLLEVSSLLLSNTNPDFFLVRIDVRESQSGQVVSNGLSGSLDMTTQFEREKKPKVRLDGNPSSSSSSNPKLQAKLVAKFSKTLSYHKTKKEYVYVVQVLVPDRLESPILAFKSPPFRVFSRKPNRKRKSSSTLASSPSPTAAPPPPSVQNVFVDGGVASVVASNVGIDLVSEPATKRRRVMGSGEETSFLEFRRKFEELVRFQSELQGPEREQCAFLLQQWAARELLGGGN